VIFGHFVQHGVIVFGELRNRNFGHGLDVDHLE